MDKEITKTGPHQWTSVGEVLISFTVPGSIGTATWDAYVKELNKCSRYLSLCIGAVNVTSHQRKLAADALVKRKVPVVVVADDRITRGMVTAVSWLGVNIKSFSWEEIRPAVKHLGVPAWLEDRCVEVSFQYRKAHGGE
jgi:hypothetical protein